MVYQIPCLNCDEVYIGETGRQMKTRQAEHQQDIEDNAVGVRTRSERGSTSGEKHKSAITDHVNNFNHTPNWPANDIVARASDLLPRQIHEAIWIRRTKNFNRDEGSYQLSHGYDTLIFDQPTRGARGFLHNGDFRFLLRHLAGNQNLTIML